METQLIQLVKDISMPAVIALFILLILKPLLPLFYSWFRSKINGKDDPTMREELKEMKFNHLSEINRRLEVLENNDIRIGQSLDNIKDEISKCRERLSRLEAKL